MPIRSSRWTRRPWSRPLGRQADWWWSRTMRSMADWATPSPRPSAEWRRSIASASPRCRVRARKTSCWSITGSRGTRSKKESSRWRHDRRRFQMQRIEDYALIGNTRTAALVGRNGSIDWLPLPRFDSGACFAALLGDDENGRWLIAPAADARTVERRYRGDTLILDTR